MTQGAEKKCIRAFRWIVFLYLTIAPQLITAQDFPVYEADTIANAEASTKQTAFSPSPKTAWIAATLMPGLGQIYNRQYWKLPIVYGGLMGCTYAITWNNKTYQDYKDAYYSIVNDSKADPTSTHPENWSDRWQVFVPGGVDPSTRLHDTNFRNSLKRGKDYYRRYRDLSIIFTILVYGIAVADSYVDAQLFDFDVSPDLSFNITPTFVPETAYHARSYGINICMTF